MSRENPTNGSVVFRNGKTRITSWALGNVALSGIWQRLLTPHIEESTTKRGGLLSLVANPRRPMASFVPNSA